MTLTDFIQQARGRTWCIRFIKRTNDRPRQMIARFGVHKGVNGKGLRYSRKAHNLMGCYEMGMGHRCVPLDGIVELRFNKRSWRFDNRKQMFVAIAKPLVDRGRLEFLGPVVAPLVARPTPPITNNLFDLAKSRSI